MEVSKLDITVIIVIVLGGAFIIGGTLAGHYASKASEKDTDEMNKSKN